MKCYKGRIVLFRKKVGIKSLIGVRHVRALVLMQRITDRAVTIWRITNYDEIVRYAGKEWDQLLRVWAGRE